MIHVKVTKADIKKGRMNANQRCGCPIWHAMNRALRRVVSTEQELEITAIHKATLGNFKLLLPDSAQDFQEELIADFSAPVAPFEFDADVVLR